MGCRREGPPTSGIVLHGSRLQRSGSGPDGNRSRFAWTPQTGGSSSGAEVISFAVNTTQKRSLLSTLNTKQLPEHFQAYHHEQTGRPLKMKYKIYVKLKADPSDTCDIDKKKLNITRKQKQNRSKRPKIIQNVLLLISTTVRIIPFPNLMRLLWLYLFNVDIHNDGPSYIFCFMDNHTKKFQTLLHYFYQYISTKLRQGFEITDIILLSELQLKKTCNYGICLHVAIEREFLITIGVIKAAIKKGDTITTAKRYPEHMACCREKPSLFVVILNKTLPLIRVGRHRLNNDLILYEVGRHRLNNDLILYEVGRHRLNNDLILYEVGRHRLNNDLILYEVGRHRLNNDLILYEVGRHRLNNDLILYEVGRHRLNNDLILYEVGRHRLNNDLILYEVGRHRLNNDLILYEVGRHRLNNDLILYEVGRHRLNNDLIRTDHLWWLPTFLRPCLCCTLSHVKRQLITRPTQLQLRAALRQAAAPTNNSIPPSCSTLNKPLERRSNSEILSPGIFYPR
ncbi:hypothetical protein PR048_022595 [Dryococelus australis]|uniref:Uncharacterized protein n=1 Tax=Dryococelus australis TaxID=614101 RepID=A0ABQ9H1F0_9NEOP|nr:hypothetical protein PR048_022595 [Dryococelus australis]